MILSSSIYQSPYLQGSLNEFITEVKIVKVCLKMPEETLDRHNRPLDKLNKFIEKN